MTLPNYPSPEVKAFGEKVNEAMYAASIREGMGGLGGCKPLDLSDFDEDVRPYVSAYLEGNFDSVAVTYAAMRAKELEGSTTSPDTNLTYVDHDGARREVRGCQMTVDKLGRHWIWSERLQQNLVYQTKGRENALLASIDSLLFTIQLRDERIAALRRVFNLAERFANEAFPPDIEEGD